MNNHPIVLCGFTLLMWADRKTPKLIWCVERDCPESIADHVRGSLADWRTELEAAVQRPRFLSVRTEIVCAGAACEHDGVPLLSDYEERFGSIRDVAKARTDGREVMLLPARGSHALWSMPGASHWQDAPMHASERDVVADHYARLRTDLLNDSPSA